MADKRPGEAGRVAGQAGRSGRIFPWVRRDAGGVGGGGPARHGQAGGGHGVASGVEAAADAAAGSGRGGGAWWSAWLGSNEAQVAYETALLNWPGGCARGETDG